MSLRPAPAPSTTSRGTRPEPWCGPPSRLRPARRTVSDQLPPVRGDQGPVDEQVGRAEPGIAPGDVASIAGGGRRGSGPGAAIAVRTRIFVRVISSVDCAPGASIICSSPSAWTFTLPARFGVPQLDAMVLEQRAIRAYWLP